MGIVSFACKDIRKEELIRCSFGLNKTQYKVLKFLLEKKRHLQASEIASGVDLERTTVQKALPGMLAKKLVTRKQSNLQGGGYVFRYRITDPVILKRKSKEAVHAWHESVLKEIDSW